MGDWVEDMARVEELRQRVEAEPDTVASSITDLLELAHTEQWAVQRTAVNTLGAGLRHRPAAGVSELDALVRTALDDDVPSPGRWRNGLVAVAAVAPETTRDAAIEGFDAIPSAQRDDIGERCVARALEHIALDEPDVLADSLDALRAICRSSAPRARRHLLGAHLALLESHRESVRPVLSDLLAEFEAGTGTTRRVAADLLSGLARDREDGPDVVEVMIRWLATHPRRPREHRPRLGPREPVMRPSLTGIPSRGVLGVTQILARLAEETPTAVAPHCGDIAASLVAWESTPDDQWPRSHLARALAAVARQRPHAVTPAADTVLKMLDDDSEFVRFWAARILLAMYPDRPDIVSPVTVGTLLTDTNPDVQGLGADLAIACITDRIVSTDGLVPELRSALSEDDGFTGKRILRIFTATARDDPEAVRPALPTLEGFLDDALTASDAAAVFEAVATEDATAVSDAVPTLVDCLFADTIVVRTAAADTLATVGARQPSLLDSQLSVLLTVVEQPHAGVDAVGDVLVTVPDSPIDGDRTVFEFVRARSTADDPTVRRTATRLLSAFVEADTETEAAVAALRDRVADTDEGVQEAALTGLATYVADTGAASLVRSCYQTDTDHWRTVSANLLARATLLDGEWPSSSFQCWLADRLHETTGETRRSFIEAAGSICEQSDAEAKLVSALLASLDDDAVSHTAFTAVRRVVTDGETTVPTAELAPAVERAVLDPDRDISPAGHALLSHVAADIDAPQRVADQLVDWLAAGRGDAGHLSAALASLCRRDVMLSETDIVAALKRHAVDESGSPRSSVCQHCGRVLRELDGAEALRETFVPIASGGPPERRAAAYSVLASVAEVWPAGVRPAGDTIREGVRDDHGRVSDPALSALVTVGRESPAVLRPIAEWLTSRRAVSDRIEPRRRRYEGIALLAADDDNLTEAVYHPLRSGLLDDDTAVEEYALEAAAQLDDPRLVPLLRRLDHGVPDWNVMPTHCHTAADGNSATPFENGLPADERTLTASDVLDQRGR